MRNDIEIYVRDCSLAEIRSWLSTIFGPVSDFEEAGAAWTCRSGDVGFIITPGVEGGPFISIWFSATGTPWRTHADCARQVARQLEIPVRCIPGPEFPEVHPCSDIVLEISGGTERLVIWE